MAPNVYDIMENLYVGTEGFNFNGYAFLGYVGNPERNYITDAWLQKAVADLKWTEDMVREWVCSRYGRWLMDSEPMSLKEFREYLDKDTQSAKDMVEAAKKEVEA